MQKVKCLYKNLCESGTIIIERTPEDDTKPKYRLFDRDNGKKYTPLSIYSHGKAYGAAQTEVGLIGECGAFNGSTDYVGIPHNDRLNITSKFSIVFWARRFSTGLVGLVEKGQDGWDILINSGTEGSITLRSGGFSTYDHVVTNFLDLNTWTFCVITYDASAGADNLKFYKNSTNVANFTETGGLCLSTAPLRLGATPMSAWYYNGYLDEVSIWSRVLTGSEITDLYNSGAGKMIPWTMQKNINGYWRFDEESWAGAEDEVKDSILQFTTEIITDRFSYAEAGTATGATINPNGKIIGCAYFNGSSDFITVDHNDKLNISSKFSIAFWAKRQSTAFTGIMEKGTFYTGWDIDVNGGAEGRISLRSTGLSTVDHVVSDFLDYNTWTFCVITYDASAGADNLKFYKNSINVANFTETGGLLVNDNALSLGALPNGGPQYFEGFLDEVAIWSRALAGSEITEIFNAGSGKLITGTLFDGVVGYWQFDVGAVRDTVRYNDYAVDCLIVPGGHNLKNMTLKIDYSDNYYTWTQLVAEWTQSDNDQIIKSFELNTNRYIRLTIYSSVMPQVAELFLGPSYTFEENPNLPYGPFDPEFNVENRVVSGGADRFLIHGDAKRRRFYDCTLKRETQKASALMLNDAWAGSKPFWLCDHDGVWIYGKLDAPLNIRMEDENEDGGIYTFQIYFKEVLP